MAAQLPSLWGTRDFLNRLSIRLSDNRDGWTVAGKEAMVRSTDIEVLTRPMAKRALTVTQVAALKGAAAHWVAPSLYLQIRSQGTRSWLFRYSRDGGNQWMGLGAEAAKTLSEARDEAAMLRVLVKRGGDPVAEKREVQANPRGKGKVPSFAECADQYIESHRAGWKNDKHIAQWECTSKTYCGPIIGKMPVDRVTVEDVLKVLKPVWTSKPETGSRLRGRIESVLGWATAMKFRARDNPATWKGALSHLLPATSKVQTIEHHKAVPYKDMDSISAKTLMFTILTVARTGETIGAVPAEIDREQKLWVVPPERMKAGREHRVPLDKAAIVILDSLPAGSRYLFPGARGGMLSNMAMLMMLRGIRDDGPTVHGFSPAFSTWAREQTNYPREIVEACLAHASGDAVEMAYLRTDFIDKRRALMADWARFCNSYK